MPMHPVEPDRFRAVMGHFATGVAVVTASGPEGPFGHDGERRLLALARPAAAARLLRRTARARSSVVRETERFGVNVLAAGQEALARRFASKLPEAEKFDGVAARRARRHPGPRGRARLGRLRRSTGLIPGGDHTIGIGAVAGGRDRRRAATRWSGSAARYGGARRDRRAHRRSASRWSGSTSRRALYGAIAWWRWRDAPGFWPLLRTGQALVAVEAPLGGVLLALGEELPPLHLVYGLTPLVVAVLRRAAARRLGADRAGPPRARRARRRARPARDRATAARGSDRAPGDRRHGRFRARGRRFGGTRLGMVLTSLHDDAECH